MSEAQGLVISTSSLATALFISIMVHIVCGIYCLVKSRFKRSSTQPKDSEWCHQSSFCHAHQNQLTYPVYNVPHKSSHLSRERKSIDYISSANGLHNCSWTSAQSVSNSTNMGASEPPCNELSSSNPKNDLVHLFNPNLTQTVNAGFPLLLSMKELYQVTERSISQTVCNKHIVSVTHLVTETGDTLYLDNTGISLHVPPGAVGPQQNQLISLVLNWDLSDNPCLEEHQSLVSPVVYCGPHGLNLKKSCVLVYKHCAYNAKHLNIMVSETELCGQKTWQLLETCSNSLRDKKNRVPSKKNSEKTVVSSVTVTQDECRVNISSFTLYTAIMTIPSEEKDRSLHCGKWLQVAVFSYPLYSDVVHHQTRIYFLNKTPCALQWAIQNESKFGGSMCCPEKVFLFHGSHSENGKDMMIRATYMSENWELIDDTDDSNKIPFLYIWHGKCPYASICFRRKSTTDQDCLQELILQFLIYQENMEDAGEKLTLQTLPVLKPCRLSDDACEDRVCMKHAVSQISINVSLNKGIGQSALYRVASQLKCRRIPQDLRLKLRLLLDPSCPFGNNWKFLASAMGLDSSIRYLSTFESPTEELMDILEQNMNSLDDLRVYLQDIDRLDAMKEVEDFIEKTAENC